MKHPYSATSDPTLANDVTGKFFLFALMLVVERLRISVP